MHAVRQRRPKHVWNQAPETSKGNKYFCTGAAIVALASRGAAIASQCCDQDLELVGKCLSPRDRLFRIARRLCRRVNSGARSWHGNRRVVWLTCRVRRRIVKRLSRRIPYRLRRRILKRLWRALLWLVGLLGHELLQFAYPLHISQRLCPVDGRKSVIAALAMTSRSARSAAAGFPFVRLFSFPFHRLHVFNGRRWTTVIATFAIPSGGRTSPGCSSKQLPKGGGALCRISDHVAN
jgi:hypothetical protein